MEKPKKEGLETFTRGKLEVAKRRLLEKCKGSRAITPIEPTNVENIIDQFLLELDKGKS
jgi:hypothetical protein